MHICTVTVAIVYKCSILHKLMWCFFGSKCVKEVTFFILQNYTQTDVITMVRVKLLLEEVHRIIYSGYFQSCIPVAMDTRDGIRLVFQVSFLLVSSISMRNIES